MDDNHLATVAMQDPRKGTSWYFKRCALLAAFGGTFFGYVHSKQDHPD